MTTLLAKRVKFKSLMHELSKQEFVHFMSKMFDENKTDIITTSLFIHLSDSSLVDQLNDTNNILTNIIQSRKQKTKLSAINNMKLDKLSTSIIGHTASFLDQYSYLQLQKANRSTFIGCNAPNMLKQLDLTNVTQYSSINLTQFISLQQLRINMHEFDKFVLPNDEQYIMNELDELWLDAKKQNNCNIDSFLNANCIDVANIKTLTLCSFGAPSNLFTNIDGLRRLLQRFPNIEYLYFYGLFVTDNNMFNGEELKALYPNLKGLSLYHGDKIRNNEYINTFGKELDFMLHSNSPSDTFDFNNIDFSKLQQLRLITPAAKSVNDILKTAQNLQKVAIEPNGYWLVSPSKEALKIAIPQILKCKSLEYFEIHTNDENYEMILDGIERGLYETQKLKRKQFKIRVKATNQSRIDPNNMIFNIDGIIHRFESSDIKDFMFIWDLRKIDKTIRKQLDGDKILNKLIDIRSNINVYAEGLYFVVTNKNCKISGWKESWLMNIV